MRPDGSDEGHEVKQSLDKKSIKSLTKKIRINH